MIMMKTNATMLKYLSVETVPEYVIPAKAGIDRINDLQVKRVTSQKVRALIEPVQGWDQHFRDA